MNITITLRSITRLFAVSTLVGHSMTVFAQSDYRIAYVRNEQICLTGPAKPVHCITNDKQKKYLPVWSPDGNRIAYIEGGDNSFKLATVVVIDRDGKRIASIPIKTINADEIRSGMRYVESSEWISGSRLAVSGTINPSSREYVVINIDTAQVANEFVSDGSRASFSSDGLSYAAVTGAPHFTQREARAPTLVVDGRQIVGLVPNSMDIAGPPAWAPDGSAIAIPLRNAVFTRNEGVSSVVIWDRNSGLKQSIIAPAHTGEIRWGSNGLIITTMPKDTLYGQIANATHDWELLITTRPVRISAWQPVRGPTLLALDKDDQRLRFKLRDSLEVDGGINIDIWCISCGLSNLPRRVPR